MNGFRESDLINYSLILIYLQIVVVKLWPILFFITEQFPLFVNITIESTAIYLTSNLYRNGCLLLNKYNFFKCISGAKISSKRIIFYNIFYGIVEYVNSLNIIFFPFRFRYKTEQISHFEKNIKMRNSAFLQN